MELRTGSKLVGSGVRRTNVSSSEHVREFRRAATERRQWREWDEERLEGKTWQLTLIGLYAEDIRSPDTSCEKLSMYLVSSSSWCTSFQGQTKSSADSCFWHQPKDKQRRKQKLQKANLACQEKGLPLFYCDVRHAKTRAHPRWLSLANHTVETRCFSRNQVTSCRNSSASANRWTTLCSERFSFNPCFPACVVLTQNQLSFSKQQLADLFEFKKWQSQKKKKKKERKEKKK